jgi:hypothetical protein
LLVTVLNKYTVYSLQYNLYFQVTWTSQEHGLWGCNNLVLYMATDISDESSAFIMSRHYTEGKGS